MRIYMIFYFWLHLHFIYTSVWCK